jgi:low temperature requirement protein LtrA
LRRAGGALPHPGAFGARAPLLVAGYVGIQVVRNLFVVLVTDRKDPLYRPVQRILGWSFAVMPLWIAGALVDGSVRVVVWAIALALDYAGPLAGHALPGLGRSHPRDWNLEPSHFVERLELFSSSRSASRSWRRARPPRACPRRSCGSPGSWWRCS